MYHQVSMTKIKKRSPQQQLSIFAEKTSIFTLTQGLTYC